MKTGQLPMPVHFQGLLSLSPSTECMAVTRGRAVRRHPKTPSADSKRPRRRAPAH